MAVMIKSKSNQLEMFQLFGVDPQLLELMQKEGVVITMAPNKVSAQTKHGTNCGSVPVNPGAVTLHKKGALGKNSVSVMNKALTELGQKAVHFSQSELITPEMVEKATLTAEEMVEASFPAKKKKITPKKKVSVSGKVGSLKDATDIYQPVHGTSEGSRYFAVGLSDDLKVAARVQSNYHVSVRVEGNIKKHLSALQGIGMSITTNSHASMHFDAENEEMASKAVGAVLAALPVEFTSPMPMVKRIVGKGQ